jgi:phytoene synthase
VVDDIVDGDQPLPAKRAALAAWHEELERAFSGGVPRDPVAQGLAQAHRDFGIRKEDALAILRGCEMDLEKDRYETWAALRDYCYHVASAVGLLCIEIFGYRHPGAREYAENLGLALQLTNILRDIAEDAGRGRLYLPREELRAFGVDEARLLAGARDDRVVRLLRFQAQRARTHYLRARAALRGEDRRSLMVAEIMGDTYQALLEEIERSGFDVFPPRPKIALGRPRKLAIALSAFGRSLLAA